MSKNSKHWLMAVNKPEDIEIRRYIGSFVRVKDDDHTDKVIEIEDIKGNLAHPTKFEIVSKGKHYLISMLDMFAQMNGEKVTAEEIALFDETMFHVEPNNQFGLPRWMRRGFKNVKN